MEKEIIKKATDAGYTGGINYFGAEDTPDRREKMFEFYTEDYEAPLFAQLMDEPDFWRSLALSFKWNESTCEGYFLHYQRYKFNPGKQQALEYAKRIMS